MAAARLPADVGTGAWRRDIDVPCVMGPDWSRERMYGIFSAFASRCSAVADAMQAGDADRAARTCRTAVRLARPLLKG